MKKCPVQVVLRTDDFIVSNVKLAGGSTKDFYAGKDQAFVKHKNALLSQLEAIRTIQRISFCLFRDLRIMICFVL